MIAIDNEKMLNVCRMCEGNGFTPKLTYSFNTTNKKLIITDGSIFPSGDSFLIVNVIATVEGIDRTNCIKTARGSVEIDLSDLNTSNGFNITATIVSKGRQTANLAAYEVASKVGSAEGGIVENGSETGDKEITKTNQETKKQ